jgi:dTMP kinase
MDRFTALDMYTPQFRLEQAGFPFSSRNASRFRCVCLDLRPTKARIAGTGKFGVLELQPTLPVSAPGKVALITAAVHHLETDKPSVKHFLSQIHGSEVSWSSGKVCPAMATLTSEILTTERKPVAETAPVAKAEYPGALVVVEGIDGSGKTTQLYLLKRWLEIGGYRIHFTEWNSSPLVKSATRRGKQRRLLTPTTFSLLHAADFADRCERQILPLLHGGYLVLADRYVYTAFARDAARGCSPHWLRNLYSFAPVPDITFYFRAPLDVAVNRIVAGRPKLKYYEAGMDLGLSLDRAESFRIFQERILSNYDQMIETDRFVLMDGTVRVNRLQTLMRQLVGQRVDLARFAPKKK